MKNFIFGSVATLFVIAGLSMCHAVYESNKPQPVPVVAVQPHNPVPAKPAPEAAPEPKLDLQPAPIEGSSCQLPPQSEPEALNTIGIFGLIPTRYNSSTTVVNSTTTNNSTISQSASNSNEGNGNNGNGVGNTGPGNQGNDSSNGNAGGNSSSTPPSSTSSSASTTTTSSSTSYSRQQPSLGIMYIRRAGKLSFIGGVTVESNPTFLIGAGYNF